MSNLASVLKDQGKDEQAIFLPLTSYLLKAGVEVKCDVKVTALTYASPDQVEYITVQDVHMVEVDWTGVMHVMTTTLSPSP